MEWVVGGLALLACAAVLVAWRCVSLQRRLEGALSTLASSLSCGETPAAGEGIEDTVARLGRAVAGAADRVESNQRLVAALCGAIEGISLGVVVSDLDGGVLFRNSAADALLGTRAVDALANRAVCDLLSEASAGRVVSRPLDLHGPPPRTLSLTAVPVGQTAAAVVVEDVSDRRRLDAVRRDFVANVSHELKTPVAALGLLAETLAAEEDPEVIQRLAGRMQDEAFRVARIIDDLLDLSRLEAEETARYEPVPVHMVLRVAVEQVQAAASARSVDVAVAEVPRSWTVLGDQRQLVSALANLLENAVKYSEDGSEVEVGTATDGRTIELTVRDRGIGIPSRDLDRIFERFYRVDRGRGRDTGGTGLGLSIVRHVAFNHGGEVLVQSVEGVGSTFTLRLPAQPARVGAVADAS